MLNFQCDILHMQHLKLLLCRWDADVRLRDDREHAAVRSHLASKVFLQDYHCPSGRHVGAGRWCRGWKGKHNIYIMQTA